MSVLANGHVLTEPPARRLAGNVVLVAGSTSGIGRTIAGLIEAVLGKHGRLDVPVNNAGVRHVAPVVDLPPETRDRILAINLASAFATTRLVLPAMRARGVGWIVNIASAHRLHFERQR